MTFDVAATTQPVDPLTGSLSGSIGVMFPAGTSASFSAALNIAQQARSYATMKIHGSTFHAAVFGREREQIAMALAIVGYLKGLKAVQFYAGGRLATERQRIEGVLACYLEACKCDDYRAHCNRVLADPFAEVLVKSSIGMMLNPPSYWRNESYLFPCAHMVSHGQPGLQRDHPASWPDQIQAMAVSRGCDWCPNFKPQDFRQLT